ncbi:MAG TPA: RraA family protein [Alphaproteobacteria bacterium]|nr:RraA family protein [Alphaproteobacteria bacterium]
MDALVEGFRKLAAASISDALDRLQIPGQAQGIASLKLGYRIVGRAFTVRYLPVGAAKGTVGDYVDDVPPGGVIVLDNGGRLDCTVWGDILTTVAARRKIAGTVIHGVCRDVAGSLAVDYPIFSRGKFMRTGKDRVEVDNINVPASLGEVQVRPNDIVVGTDDGVLVVPQEKASTVLEIAQSIGEAEEKIIAAVKAGSRLDEARKANNYHHLQSHA